MDLENNCEWYSLLKIFTQEHTRVKKKADITNQLTNYTVYIQSSIVGVVVGLKKKQKKSGRSVQSKQTNKQKFYCNRT